MNGDMISKAESIDLLTANEIIEIKNVRHWKGAIGQVFVYGNYYPKHKKRIHLFGKCDLETLEMIKSHCEMINITVSWEKSLLS